MFVILMLPDTPCPRHAAADAATRARARAAMLFTFRFRHDAMLERYDFHAAAAMLMPHSVTLMLRRAIRFDVVIDKILLAALRSYATYRYAGDAVVALLR